MLESKLLSNTKSSFQLLFFVYPAIAPYLETLLPAVPFDAIVMFYHI
jgi:hypothetical protein